MQLSSDQENALEKITDFILDPTKKEMALVGHSGSGKSTLIPLIINNVNSIISTQNMLTGENGKLTVKYTATTNKAATVLAEKVNVSACTIHSLLHLKVNINYSKGNTYLSQTKEFKHIHNTLLIIDEASMVSKELHRIIQRSCKNCKILYVLDPYQLLAVFESSCVILDHINDVVTLSTVMRQSNKSPIPALGEAYRTAITTKTFPILVPDNEYIIRCSGKQFQEHLDREFTETNVGSVNSKVLAWTNHKVTEYNHYIRSLHTNSEIYQIGERVITNKPILDGGYTVYATDSEITITNAVEDVVKGLEGTWYTLDNVIKVFQVNNQLELKALADTAAKNKDWVEYYALKDYFADLRPLHACTVHKSQGSTYNNVFINLEDIGKCHISHEVARMLYVALTRTANKVYLYGELPSKYSGGLYTPNF